MNTTKIAAIGILLGSWSISHASEPLTLSFARTGTELSAVSVTANIGGVSAELTSLSHAIKGVNNSIICADVNGSTSPTVVYNFSISGLPQGWTFNNVGLDIHALNASGGDQQSNDGKIRQFNVVVSSGGTTLAGYTDLDPAAGIAGVRKVWDAPTLSTVTPSNPYELTITVTKGTRNDGCFFGLQGITLSTIESETPEPPAPSTSKFYTIKWKNNTQNYITEQRNGSLAIGSYSVNNKIFWEFIPTENENCYYIKSVASGKYIGSCNMTPSSASRVTMSDEPVEYYLGQSASTSGENKGCSWLSSTDCANYDKESSGARCLNKDGASSYVITWSTGVSNVGSYWTLTETENLYEPIPPLPIHTPYTLSHQIYQIPCGTVGDTWISQATIGNDFHYPMAGKDMTYPTVNSKPSYYNILSRDAARVNRGDEAELHINLNKAPAAEYKLYVYVDWDRDGLYESEEELTCSQSIEGKINVPEEAKIGKTRMRLRLTDNGLTGADDDVNGETLDLLLSVGDASDELLAPEVGVNDPMRGSAEWANGTASATHKGNAIFLYWAEGNRILSVEPQFDIAATNNPRKITAFFTVNNQTMTGIDEALIDKVDNNASICFDGEVISVEGSEAQLIMMFAIDGKCVKAANASQLNVGGTPEGIYIAKAITSNGVVSSKIKI